MNEWFDEALRLAKTGDDWNEDQSLDILNNIMDEWFRAGKFKECDDFLETLKVEEIPLLLTTGILCITFSAKIYLNNRKDFFDKAKKYFYANVNNPEAELQGLE